MTNTSCMSRICVTYSLMEMFPGTSLFFKLSDSINLFRRSVHCDFVVFSILSGEIAKYDTKCKHQATIKIPIRRAILTALGIVVFDNLWLAGETCGSVARATCPGSSPVLVLISCCCNLARFEKTVLVLVVSCFYQWPSRPVTPGSSNSSRK